MQPCQTHADSDFPGMGSLSAGYTQGLPKAAIRSVKDVRITALQHHLRVTPQDLRRTPASQALLGSDKRRAVDPLIRQSAQMIELEVVGRLGRAEERRVFSHEPTMDET